MLYRKNANKNIYIYWTKQSNKYPTLPATRHPMIHMHSCKHKPKLKTEILSAWHQPWETSSDSHTLPTVCTPKCTKLCILCTLQIEFHYSNKCAHYNYGVASCLKHHVLTWMLWKHKLSNPSNVCERWTRAYVPNLTQIIQQRDSMTNEIKQLWKISLYSHKIWTPWYVVAPGASFEFHSVW